MTAIIRIRVNERLFVKDPEETPLGRKIVSRAIHLIDEIGYENFTFKKLAHAIDSTEASVYRYFRSKNKLLNYLRSWHWGYLNYKVGLKTENIENPRKKLEIALRIVVESARDDPITPHIDEAALHRIIVAESAKGYVKKEMNSSSKEGFYEGLELFCSNLADMAKAVNPRYEYPKALVLTVLIAAHRLMFYCEHGLKFTEIRHKKRDNTDVIQFLEAMVFKVLSS